MLKQHDYEYLHTCCKCTKYVQWNSTWRTLNASRTCISFNEFYQPAFTTYISTPCTWPVSYTTHSVCVVSMLDPAMFGCATLVSAPVKEGPRNVSFVHLQPPVHRESIGILLVYLSVVYYSWGTGARGTRMKNNAISGLPLSVCASICALIILISFTDNSYAKRE